MVKMLAGQARSGLATQLRDGCDTAVASRLAYPEVRAALAAGRNHDLDPRRPGRRAGPGGILVRNPPRRAHPGGASSRLATTNSTLCPIRRTRYRLTSQPAVTVTSST